MEERFNPKGFSTSDDQEDEGNLIIKNLLLKNKRVKSVLGGNDKTPNRDGFIELRNDKHGVGKLEIQVKPIDRPRKERSGKLCYQLPGSMIGYSKLCGLPFILVCYDRDTNKAYWKHVTESLFDSATSDQESITVELLVEDEIADDQQYTDRWFELVNRHLEAIQFANHMQPVMDALKSDKIFGQLDSPEAMVQLLKRVQQLATEKYTARLEEAQKLFKQSEIDAAAKILLPLTDELLGEEASIELLFEVYIWLGNCQYRLEQFEGAEDCFRKAIDIYPNSPKAQTNLAHIFYVRKVNKKEALNLAKAGYEGRPQDEGSIATYIMCLSFNRQFGEIERFVATHLANFDISSMLQLALGQIEKERGAYAISRECFKKAVTVDAKNYHARILFAESTHKLVRSECLKILQQGVIPNIESFNTELDEAITELDVAIEYFTQTTDRQALYRAYDYRACINILKGNFAEGLSDCDKMDAVIPDKEFARILRAQIYTQLNQFPKVIEILESLEGSKRRDILQALAYSHYRLNRWDKAAKLFSQYIDEDTDSDSELFAYVQCLWFSAQKKKAYQLALKLRKTRWAPIEIMKQVELARLLELQEWQGALDVIEDLIRAAPQDAEYYIQRVCMHINLRNREQAIRFYREFPHRLLVSDVWGNQTFRQMEIKLNEFQWL